MHFERQFSFFDRICISVDDVLRTLTNQAKTSGKAYPAADLAESSLSTAQRQHAAGLMRVNHAGEVCAQALYQGQAVVSRDKSVKAYLQHAAMEEGDHLAWCSQRLLELNSHTSYLNPFWYAGSFCIGLVAGMMGDKWSLGFVAETERQVIKHLAGHLQLLPSEDQRSYKILQQMESDEAKHHETAYQAGAMELPLPIKKAMGFISKIMVKTAYWM